MATFIHGSRQILDNSIDVIELSATGSPGSTTYLRGDNTWSTITATQPEWVQTNRIPITNQTITSNYSVIIARQLTLNSGLKISLQTNSLLKII